MVSFSTLPDDIHILTINRLFNGCSSLGHFKQHLCLLAINHAWRQIALPLVYSKAFIVYGTHKTESDTDNELTTNIDLLQHYDFTKTINIQLHYYDNPIPGLQQIAALLGCNAHRLELDLKPTVHFSQGSRADAEPLEKDLADVAFKLATALPGITEVNYGSVNYNRSASALLGYIAGHYANQLRAITSVISFTTDKLFTQLKEVNFYMDYNDILPKIVPDTLESLSIANVPPNIFSKLFQFETDVVFPKLARLYIHYASGDSDQIPLALPNLKVLKVSGKCCRIFHQAALPAHLECLSLISTGEIIQQLQNFNFPTVDNIAVNIYGADDQAFARTNHLLRHGGKCVDMFYNNPAATLTADQFTCKHITKLLLDACVNVSTIVGILAQLSRLQILTLGGIIDVDDQGALELTSSLEPFTSPIKQLALIYIDCPHGLMVKATTSLVLRMPQLKRLIAHQIDDIKLDSYVSEYPHVAGVKCIFKK
ncbi:hypothetical protein BX667DRAFT_536582 [Coemansia mojavensis]|nr:hypothetical protein BX667DRAFT_536582 [Coemansia mojavensis]